MLATVAHGSSTCQRIHSCARLVQAPPAPMVDATIADIIDMLGNARARLSLDMPEAWAPETGVVGGPSQAKELQRSTAGAMPHPRESRAESKCEGSGRCASAGERFGNSHLSRALRHAEGEAISRRTASEAIVRATTSSERTQLGALSVGADQGSCAMSQASQAPGCPRCFSGGTLSSPASTPTRSRSRTSREQKMDEMALRRDRAGESETARRARHRASMMAAELELGSAHRNKDRPGKKTTRHGTMRKLSAAPTSGTVQSMPKPQHIPERSVLGEDSAILEV